MNIIEIQIEELRTLLPVLDEKEKLGLIRPSAVKARDLIRWYERGRSFTEKQQRFIGTLIRRAKTKHRKGTVEINTTKLDSNEVASKVMDQITDNLVAKFNSQVPTMDAIVESVVPRLIDEIEKRKPRQVEISISKGTKKQKVEGTQHFKFEHLIRAACSRLPNGYAPGIFLQGEASSGKTTGAKNLAEVLNLKWHFNGAISFPHEMLGFIDGAGKYHRTPFREAYEHGGVYTFDEVDRSDPVALLAVNPHLANGVATFPDKQVKRHPDCIIICTANTWGLGADANYSGATKLDAAFLSRFPVRINWDIDLALEEAIVPHPEWLAKVRDARESARAYGLKVMIDTRAAQAGLCLIEQGYTLDEAADMTYLANLKPDQRKQIKREFV